MAGENRPNSGYCQKFHWFCYACQSLELKHAIALIGELDSEIEETEKEISSIMDAVHSHITTVPGISNQSGQLTNCYSHTEKRGSRYLRYVIFNFTKYACIHDPTFAAYLSKKRAEGKT